MRKALYKSDIVPFLELLKTNDWSVKVKSSQNANDSASTIKKAKTPNKTDVEMFFHDIGLKVEEREIKKLCTVTRLNTSLSFTLKKENLDFISFLSKRKYQFEFLFEPDNNASGVINTQIAEHKFEDIMKDEFNIPKPIFLFALGHVTQINNNGKKK